MSTTAKTNSARNVIISILFAIICLLLYFGPTYQNYQTGMESITSYASNDSGQVQQNIYDNIPVTNDLHSLISPKKYTSNKFGIRWRINYNTNPRYISVNGAKQQTIKIALFCVGSQATSTRSMIVQLNQIPEVVISSPEMHWYTEDCLQKYNNHTSIRMSAMFKYNISPSDGMNIWNHYCPIEDFISSFILSGTTKKTWLNNHRDITYYATKGPKEILYPPIANYYVNYFVKYYGTKLFVLLRNPVKRCISGLVRFEFQSTDHTKHSVMEWLIENVSSTILSQQFNKTLTRIFVQNVNDSSEDIWNDVRNQYKYLFYHFNKYDMMNQWLRSCYLPQILSWVYYLEQLNILHSFKIIQMEQLFLSRDNFQMTMNYLRCYMHSTEHDYEHGMNQCMNSTQQHFTQVHEGRKTRSFVATEEEIHALRMSFSTCNNLLRRFLVSHKYSSSILLTKQWDWKLWDLQY